LLEGIVGETAVAEREILVKDTTVARQTEGERD
jgi:hypothetical protein